MDDNGWKLAQEKGIDDFIQELKELPAYHLYVEGVRNSESDTSEVLKLIALIHSFRDKRLLMAMHEISIELLFAIVDQRLKSEIMR